MNSDSGPSTAQSPRPHGRIQGVPFWRFRDGEVEVLFLGRGDDPGVERRAALEDAIESAPEVAWAKQVHGADVLRATAGFCGEGDAIETESGQLAASVITADCVPVLLAGGRRVAAVHAGWRGLVAGVISAALERFDEPASAWIGPAIGSCCYEVSPEVAAEVVAASDPGIASVPTGAKPHLDLQQAAQQQLAAGGVSSVQIVARCTRCHPDELWSYRREGPGGGRNISYIWRTGS